MKYKMFKSVNKDLSSKYDRKFKYEIGKTLEIKSYDKSKKECSTGLHCSDIIYANGYDWNKDQKILLVEVDSKDIIVKGKDKFRCKRLKIIKVLTKEEIDIQIEKEFYEKYKVKGLWDYCKEFKNKKWLSKKITKKDKEKIKKLLINTNKKLSSYSWDYKDNIKFVSADSLRDSLRYSLRDSLRYSLRDSLRYSLRYSLMDSLRDSLRDSLMDSLTCKILKKHNSELLDDLIEVFRMGYLVAGKDKKGNWLVIVSKKGEKLI